MPHKPANNTTTPWDLSALVIVCDLALSRLTRARARPRSGKAAKLVSEAEDSVRLIRDQLRVMARRQAPASY